MSLVLALAVVVAGMPAAAPAAPALTDAQSQASAARAKLASMQTKLAAGMSAYSSASKNLSATRGRIERENVRLSDVRASLSAGETSLDTQVQFLYRTNGAGFVDVLLGAATFEQFAARLSVLQIIADKDAGLVDTLKSQRAEEESLLADLSQREADQTRYVSQVAAQRDAMQRSINEQQSYYDSLSSQVSMLIAAQEKAAALKRATAGNSGSQQDLSGAGHGGSTSSSVDLKLATVQGRSGKYWVMANDSSSFSPTGVKFSGGASVYSVADNGTGTSSGHPLNDDELTCAHRTLPFGTRVAITHGGRRIIAVVTDRGPYVSGRVLDLTPRGASLLGIDGVGDVSCEVVEGN
jgi:rare lipoprotein A (peptidoglycan hydrolase)